jgi:hypothetical protein
VIKLLLLVIKHASWLTVEQADESPVLEEMMCETGLPLLSVLSAHVAPSVTVVL